MNFLIIDIEIPEGVDAAFLAALPVEIREEVLRDYSRQQRAQRLARSTGIGDDSGAQSAGGSGNDLQPLDPEFLSALPPDLQDEIIAQHERSIRLANERQNAASGNFFIR